MTRENLVYSTETKGKNLGQKHNGGAELQEIVPQETHLKLQYEKKGRGGKGVSVVFELPHNPPYFKRLMKELKKQLGTGGAYKETVQEGQPGAQIEFQGNRIDDLRGLLQSKGFHIKG